ncbi:MAG: AAA family ATPase [Desulfomonile tiedjei]|nr:AAA family ATPase [Desulfomonile tiedjei]
MNQLVLTLNVAPRFTFDNLIVHEGIEAAVSAVRSVYEEPERPLPPLFLFGGPGTGKTHILKATASLVDSARGQRDGASRFFSLGGTSEEGTSLDTFAAQADNESARFCCVAVDDIHLLSPEQSAHLWGLSNKATRRGSPLLLASGLSIQEVFRDNPHMESRVKAGLVFQLAPPEDNVRMLILDKMARDRNVRVSRDVCSYLVTRKSRNLRELSRLLEILDHESLVQKRRITLPLIKTLERDGFV